MSYPSPDAKHVAGLRLKGGALGRGLAALALTLAVSALSAAEPVGETPFFRHASFADFSGGEVSSPGTGLYVARKGDRGEIRWINRYDYNNNGFPEVVVVNDHNHYDTSPAVLYRWSKDGPPLSLLPPVPEDGPGFEVFEHYTRARQQATLLPVLGGLSTAVGDFNGDGFEDIAISGFVHGWNAEPYPLVLYPGGPAGFDAANPVLWPAGFYTGIAAADLDGDGFADLIVTRRDGEYVTRANVRLPRAERFEAAAASARKSLILFGGKNLDAPARTLELETVYALDAATADLDGNGHPDIVFYEAGPDAGVRIYLAGKDRGFSGTGTLIEVGGNTPWGFAQRKLHLADLDGDGARDIVVPTVTELVVLWNDGNGNFAAERKISLPISGVFATAAGDFNGNGKRDLAVAVFAARGGQPDSSLVLMNNGKGITEWEKVLVPLQRAYGVTAADLNGSGFDDVVFARYFDPVTGAYDANSAVYWGGPHGIHPANSATLATFGAVDVATVPSARAGKRDILFVNRHSGLRGAGTGPTSGGMPSYIYWGNPTRSYSELDMLKLPPLANELPIAAADLAAEDGGTDIVAFELGHRKLSIFRIADGTYGRVKSFDLPGRARMLHVADIDRDGVLDVLATAGDKLYLIRNPLAAEAVLEEVELPSPITGGFVLGDIDGDGLVDLVYRSEYRMVVVPGAAGKRPAESRSFLSRLISSPPGIFGRRHSRTAARAAMAPAGGFDTGRSYSSPEIRKYSLYPNLADFDGDGRLDLLAFVFSELDERGIHVNQRTDSLLFWNRDGKLDLAHPTPVPSLGGAHSGAVADVNRDGRPDIVSANYHGGDTRLLDAQVLWNDGSRVFTRDNSLTLPAFSAAAAQAMDYDRDGFMDLLIFNHSEPEEVFPGLPLGARHSVGARLYWGGKDGFARDRFTWIPTYGPHSKQLPDPGNSADRSPRESYTSAVIPVPAALASGFIEVKARLGHSGSVAVEVRSRGTNAPNAAWQTLPLVARTGDTLRFGPVKLAPGGQFRYRLILDSALLGTFPVVGEVAGIGVPGAPFLTLLNKTPSDTTSPLMHASYLRPDGLEMVKIGAYSPDNGRTWETFAPAPDFDAGLPHGYRRESFPLFRDPETGTVLRVVPSLDTPGLDPNAVEPPIALEKYYLRYRVSTDGGRTFHFDEPIIAEGFTEANPFAGVHKGRNGLFMGDVGSQILRTRDGHILIPAQVCTLGDDDKLHSPGGGFTYTDVLILIGRWRPDHRLTWRTSERIVADPARSTRGMIEPTLAETRDGRLLCIMRGSNGGSKDPQFAIPSHKWRSVSTDGGIHWSPPEPWTYDDGEPFFSPSAMSQLLTHSSGRIFWIGNIHHENCRGNHPRHPLVIGEVHPESLRLIRSSVIELDRVQPDEGDVNLSHWWGFEDRETGNIVVAGHRHNIGYTARQPVTYVVTVTAAGPVAGVPDEQRDGAGPRRAAAEKTEMRPATQPE